MHCNDIRSQRRVLDGQSIRIDFPRTSSEMILICIQSDERKGIFLQPPIALDGIDEDFSP